MSNFLSSISRSGSRLIARFRGGDSEFIQPSMKTYYDGDGPTITDAPNSWVIVDLQFIPYQVQSGIWRLKFNFAGTSSSVTDLSLAVNVSTGATNPRFQALNGSVLTGSTSTSVQGWVAHSSGDWVVAASSTSASWVVSGDIQLSAKPSWAD